MAGLFNMTTNSLRNLRYTELFKNPGKWNCMSENTTEAVNVCMHVSQVIWYLAGINVHGSNRAWYISVVCGMNSSSNTSIASYILKL